MAPNTARVTAAQLVDQPPGVEPGRDGGPGAGRRTAPRRRLSARGRILGWSVALLTASLFVSTGAVYVLLSRRADAVIGQDLLHEVDEFRALRPVGLPAGPGHVAAELRVATGRTVPKSNIILIGLLDGRVRSVSSASSVAAVESEAGVLARLADSTVPVRGTLELRAGTARFTALPVRAAVDPARGTFVVAVLTGPERATVTQVTRLLLEVGAAALLLAALLAWLLAGRVLRPVRATTELARRITDTDLSDRLPVGGTDEVAQMAATFNAMLDRLQAAVAAQRRFLADAGHELRTPITIVQGNLDTLGCEDAEDAETLALVADELDRMTRLVDELSLLAATERPDFLRPAPTELAELGAALAAKLEPLGGRPWTRRLSVHGVALVDAHRVTQAVVQLAANAVAHTAPGVPLELHVARDAATLEISVVDHGGGVPAAQRRRIFERFVRLDHGHGRSTGLGLSIVSAIAAAHGGSVAVGDTPGGGATFTLRLPLRAPAAADDCGRGRGAAVPSIEGTP